MEQGIVTETRTAAEARVIFTCLVMAESKKKKPDFHALAKLSYEAARIFNEESAACGQYNLAPTR